MKIEEARKRKEELQDNIKQMLDTFMSETGLVIDGITFDTLLNYEYRSARIVSLSEEVHI